MSGRGEEGIHLFMDRPGEFGREIGNFAIKKILKNPIFYLTL